MSTVQDTHIHTRAHSQVLCYWTFVFCTQILLLSMKDMNIAKLTAVDLPLFNGIMSDLFPGIETPSIDYSKVGLDFVTEYYLQSASL